MKEFPDPVEQETQRLICHGEDLLDRTHDVAERILNKVSRAIGGLPTREHASSRDEAAFRR